jgi:hypothetical protein
MEEGKPKPAGKMEKTETTVSAESKPIDMALESADVLAKGYEQCMTLTCEQLGRLFPAAADRLSELATFGKGNLDAWILAGSEAAKGWEGLSTEIIGYNRQLWDEGLKRAEALLGCGSLEELVSLQSEAVKDQFNTFLAEGSKLGKMTATAASAAAGPINERLGKAAGELTKPIAA